MGAADSGGRGHLRKDQQQMRRRNCHQCGLGVQASSVAWRVQRKPHGSFRASWRWARLSDGVSTVGLFAGAEGEATGVSSESAGLRPMASANSAARCSSVRGGTSRWVGPAISALIGGSDSGLPSLVGSSVEFAGRPSAESAVAGCAWGVGAPPGCHGGTPKISR